jgi:hypothetical protein
LVVAPNTSIGSPVVPGVAFTVVKVIVALASWLAKRVRGALVVAQNTAVGFPEIPGVAFAVVKGIIALTTPLAKRVRGALVRVGARHSTTNRRRIHILGTA